MPLALVVALAAFAVFRRRRGNAPESSGWAEAEEVAPTAAEAQPAPIAAPKVVPVAAEPTPIAPQPASPPAPASTAVTLSFEPASLRLSLVYATLQYRLTIAATDDMPAAHLLGDMIGAHASIPPEQQLTPALDTLAPLNPVPAIAAGETLTLKGGLQLPLSAIRPLQQGNASFFVPLVRLCLVGENGGAMIRRVFTVGIDGGAAALAPLRLDTGPQEHRQLAAREVETARGYPLQPNQRRAAG